MNRKGRKVHMLIGTCLAAALPCLAPATPHTDMALGQVDAILDFCEAVAPGLKHNLEITRRLFSHNGVGATRNSTAYNDGYLQVHDALAKGNRAQETATCKANFSSLP